MLFVQGGRDAFGKPGEFGFLETVSPPATLHVVEGGDHSFKLTSKDPARQATVFDDVQQTILEWIRARQGRRIDSVAG